MIHPSRQQNWLVTILTQRTVQVIMVLWFVATVFAYWLGADGLPFDRPSFAGFSLTAQLAATFALVLVLPLIHMGLTYLITRNRPQPNLADRVPSVAIARQETVIVVLYGLVIFALGQALGRAVWGAGFGGHMHGSLFGASRHTGAGEALTWAAYNFITLALIPYLYFRNKGYSNAALSLTSANPRNDWIIILVVGSVGVITDLLIGNLLTLSGRQLLFGIPLAFVIGLLGTGLPVMVFIYSILLPRYARLTNSTLMTVLLGGVTYASFHLFDSWTAYTSVPNVLLSIIFVFFQFFGPGMLKAYLTLRTGNAWVHLWAYHAISPHVTVDTPLMVETFNIQ